MSCPSCGYCSHCGRSNGYWHWHNPTNATPLFTWINPNANATAPTVTGVTWHTYPGTAATVPNTTENIDCGR